MDHPLLLTILIGCVSLLYATAGQAGGTGFLAVMAFAGFPAGGLRPTALLLNIVAASYATWRLQRRRATDWGLLLPIMAPSLVTAFAGGSIVLDGGVYFTLTAALLIVAAGVMLFRQSADAVEGGPVRLLPAMLAGAGAGLLSGLTGVGDGVFLVPQLVAFGWALPKRTAGISAPFILCNSVLGFAGTLLAGQRVAAGAALYSVGALAGAILGTAIGLRWMLERATRHVLASILLFAGVRLPFR